MKCISCHLYQDKLVCDSCDSMFKFYIVQKGRYRCSSCHQVKNNRVHLPGSEKMCARCVYRMRGDTNENKSGCIIY